MAPILGSAPAGEFYSQAWIGTFGSNFGLANVLTVATPLMIAGLAASIPYRLGLWNIGIDGQILIGGWLATAIAFTFSSLAGPVLIPLMMLAGMLGGAIWILIPALARAFLGVSEIITTFLLNFVATAWMIYWVSGPWIGEGQGAGGLRSREIPDQAEFTLLNLNGVLVHWGLVIAIALPLALWAAIRFSRAGYELTITGASARAGRFAGINVRRKLILAMVGGGALAGLAGTIDMLGTIHQYGSGLSNNTGFAAVVVAVLAGRSEVGVLIMAFLYATLLAGGDAVGIIGASPELVFGLIGITLMSAAVGEATARLRLVRTRREAISPTRLATDPKASAESA